LGVLADPDDTDAVAAAIERIVEGVTVSPNEEVIARFDRCHMARAMAECLRRAATEGYRG
jgi:hypothetical protein